MRGKSWTPESRIEIEESRRRVEDWREDTQPVREEIVLVVPKDIFGSGLVGWCGVVCCCCLEGLDVALCAVRCRGDCTSSANQGNCRLM